MLIHISHFPYWIVVISSSFMCFNKFLECIDDLLRSTEIETKKPEKMDKSWRRSKQNQGERSRAGHSPIMGWTTAQNCQKEGKTRGIAGRSPKSSRTIARVTNREKTPWGERSPTLGERSPSLAVVLQIWTNVLQANFQHRIFMSRTLAKLSRTTAKLRWCKNDDVLTSFQDGKLG